MRMLTKFLPGDQATLQPLLQGLAQMVTGLSFLNKEIHNGTQCANDLKALKLNDVALG